MRCVTHRSRHFTPISHLGKTSKCSSLPCSFHSKNLFLETFQNSVRSTVTVPLYLEFVTHAATLQLALSLKNSSFSSREASVNSGQG